MPPRRDGGRVSVQRCGLAVALTLASSLPALAATEQQLFGNWCGTESSYAINAKAMVVTRHSDGAKLVFDVVKIEPKAQSLLVQWRLQGRIGGTEFGEFSTDGLKMSQLPNAKGPRREFKRC